MKKRGLSLIIALVMSISGVMVSSAQTGYYVTNNTFPNPFSVVSSRSIEKNPRGMYISSGTLQISDPGNGEIEVYVNTLAHQDIDSTTFVIYLDRWIESDKSWLNVADFNFDYKQSDYPDEDLAMKVLSFNVIGQPSNFYYRLRGIHRVQVGSVVEYLYSQTDGILITNKK